MGERSSLIRTKAAPVQPQEALFDTHAEVSLDFELASTAELDLLLGLGVPAAEVFYSNPMRSRDAIAYAAAKGVEWYAVDSLDELRRVHQVKPDARQYLRIGT